MHSHKVHNAEAYSYLRVGNEVQIDFINYFNSGMTPAAAKNYHEIKLTALDDLDDEMEYIKVLANAQLNPTERQVYQMFDNWRFLLILTF